MKKVVLLLRVSTNSQDYEYQRNTLTDICKRNRCGYFRCILSDV